MTDLQFPDEPSMLVGLGILLEAGAQFMPVGGNAVTVDAAGFDALDDEQAAELAKLTGGAGLASVQPEQVPAAQVAALAAATEPPPRTGPGASRDAWAAWATEHKVTFQEDASRDEIIAAVDAAQAQEAPDVG